MCIDTAAICYILKSLCAPPVFRGCRVKGLVNGIYYYFIRRHNISSDNINGRLYKSGTCHKAKSRLANGKDVPILSTPDCGSIGTCLTGVPQSTDGLWKTKCLMYIDIETDRPMRMAKGQQTHWPTTANHRTLLHHKLINCQTTNRPSNVLSSLGKHRDMELSSNEANSNEPATDNELIIMQEASTALIHEPIQNTFVRSVFDAASRTKVKPHLSSELHNSPERRCL